MVRARATVREGPVDERNALLAVAGVDSIVGFASLVLPDEWRRLRCVDLAPGRCTVKCRTDKGQDCRIDDGKVPREGQIRGI